MAPVVRPALSIVVTPRPEIRVRRSVYTSIVKPAFDRVAAVLGLLVAAIPMAVIALVVLVTMGRPVLFRQTRIGRGGERFDVLKFRTMKPDRRGMPLDVIHDRRRTHKSRARSAPHRPSVGSSVATAWTSSHS